MGGGVNVNFRRWTGGILESVCWGGGQNFENLCVCTMWTTHLENNEPPCIPIWLWSSSIAVRALAFFSEDPRLETHSELRVGHSFTFHPAANGNLVETLRRKRLRGKELATLPHKADGPEQVSSLTVNPQLRIVYLILIWLAPLLCPRWSWQFWGYLRI